MSDTPITVNASPAKAIATAVFRHMLTLAGGYLVTKGFLDQGMADQAVDQVLGLALALAPGAWAAIRAKLQHDKLMTAATGPDPQFQVK